MNQKSRSYVGLFQVFVVLGVLAFFTCQSFAGVSSIYKWKDDQGKTHFTDDPLKIPPRYRSGADLEKRRALPPPKTSLPKSPQPENTASVDKNVEDQKNPDEKTNDSGADKKDKELAAMRDALSFLKSDIQRYKKYDEYVPQHRHAIVLRDEIVSVLPAKEALAKKLEPFESTVLKQISSFLKVSLQKDYESKKREYPRRLIFISERTRLNGELPAKSSLVEKLTAELASAPEKASSQPISPKPQEPVQNVQKDEPKTLRSYGGAYGK